MFRPAKICAIYLAIALLVFAILDRSDAFSASLNTARLQGRRRTLSEVGLGKDSHNVENKFRIIVDFDSKRKKIINDAKT